MYGCTGMSGHAAKHTALANVRKMRELLDERIDVVGVGGVASGQDAFEMILCGAAAVQVGTCHWTEGGACFQRIADELKAIMERKGYGTLGEFRNQLKPWSKERAAASRKRRKAGKAVGGGGGGGGGGGAAAPASLFWWQTAVAVLVVIVATLFARDQGLLRQYDNVVSRSGGSA